jgi:hypothetical protein
MVGAWRTTGTRRQRRAIFSLPAARWPPSSTPPATPAGGYVALRSAELAVVGAGEVGVRRLPRLHGRQAHSPPRRGSYWALLVQGIEACMGEPGLVLAPTSIPLVAISFTLVRVEVVAFSLVPAVTIFGLSAGGGDESVARLGFTIFLPLALLAVGYAMVFSGEELVAPSAPRGPYAAQERSPLGWRSRHWAALGASIAAVRWWPILSCPHQRRATRQMIRWPLRHQGMGGDSPRPSVIPSAPSTSATCLSQLPAIMPRTGAMSMTSTGGSGPAPRWVTFGPSSRRARVSATLGPSPAPAPPPPRRRRGVPLVLYARQLRSSPSRRPDRA